MFLKVFIDGKESKLKKQKLCWLLQSESVRISTDITRRFIPKRSIISHSSMQDINIIIDKLLSMTRGDFVVIFHDQCLFTGMVLNFQKSNETSKAKRKVLNDVLDLSNNEEIYFSLDPLYEIESRSFKPFLIEKFIYFPQSSYICHLLHGIADLEKAYVASFLKESLNKMSGN